VIGILGSQTYFIYELKYGISNVEDELINLKSKVEVQKKESDSNVKDLREKSLSAFESLGNDLDDLRIQSSESRSAIQQLSEGLEELENVQIEASQDFSLIIEDVIESVVSVRATRGSLSSLGSAVFVSPEYLITNYHVIEDKDDFVISTYNGERFNADLIGYESTIDIAVLKVENGNFDYLDFEDIDNVNVGEKVIAIGSPLGLSFSVTQGIVSSKNRVGPNGLNIYLQTDTPINPGNSGGPLVNLNKNLVAINTWKIGGVEGLGFSIRSEVVEDVYEQIIEQV
jgi:S1-C subfamily serine protease